jgi:hypothetical protein
MRRLAAPWRFLLTGPRRPRQGAGQTLPDRGLQPAVPAPCVHPPAHRRPSLRHGGIYKGEGGGALGATVAPGHHHRRTMDRPRPPALVAHGHRPRASRPTPRRRAARPPLCVPLFPAPSENPETGLLPPPIVNARSAPDLHIFVYTVFVPLGDPGLEHPPGWDPAQKFSYEKFFRDLDDGGHSDKVGKPLKASSNGRWGPSWLSAKR